MDASMTPSKKDLKSICDLRKDTGLGCNNCVYYEVCNQQRSYKSRDRKKRGGKKQMTTQTSTTQAPRTKTGPQTIGSNRKRTNKAMPVRCVESNEVYPSLGRAARVFGTTRSTLQKYIEAGEPITLTLTFEYAEDIDND